VEGQKMSKSLGNFVTIADVLKDWPGEVARFNMLRTHYRQPIDWTLNGLRESQSIIEGFYADIELAIAGEVPREIVESLSDDLNLSTAIAHMHVLRKSERHGELKKALNMLGLSLDAVAPGAELNQRYSFHPGRASSSVNIDREAVVRLIEDRLLARHTKNWKESDRIRDELDAMGIAIKDNKDGTTSWEVKR
jgi:cysteinyl-tRNA synthetase